MREILFRGKRLDNGEWVYGSLVTDDANHAYIAQIIVGELVTFDVIPETVGQWTGLTDKNGEKIFEGDIVCTRYSDGKICCIGDVQFCYGVYGAEWTVDKKNKSMIGSWGQLHNLRRFYDYIINHIEVIGNIYDNTDLLVAS